MPREVFVAGQVLTAAELNVVSDQSVMVFAGTAARGSAIPSPTEGMVTYRSDDDTVEVYDGSSWNAVGPGKILQVVSTNKTDSFSTTSTSFVDVTGLTVSITPSSSSSKIFVFLTIGVLDNSGVALNGVQVLRGSTPIAIGSSTTGYGAFNVTPAGDRGSSASWSFLDSPSTTSSLTYKVQMLTLANTSYLNRNSLGTQFAVSTITAMEVAG